ncbi:MAG: tetratricopeptide repeat protein [Gemmatimonadales bacterium]
MSGLDDNNRLGRARAAGLPRVLVVYLAASWGVLQAVDIFTEQFGLPTWFFPAAVLLLLIGLPIVLATALLRTSTSSPASDQAGTSSAPVQRLTATRPAAGLLTWRRAIFGGVLAFVLLALVGAGIIWKRNRGWDLQPDVVAVLPFRVVGQGLDLWHEGMVDLLSTALDATGQFRSSDPRAVLSEWQKRVGVEGQLAGPEQAATVAGPLSAGQMILGSVVRTGPQTLRISADLISVRWLRKDGTAAVEGSEDDITSLIDQITVELLKSSLPEAEARNVRVASITTSSPAALRAYLEGEQAFRHSQFEQAAESFAEAVEIDSTFAIALYRLSQAYGWAGAPSRSNDYLIRAAAHSAGLPERDSLLIEAYKLLDVDGNLRALSQFEELTRRYPDDLEAWYGLGEAHYHIGSQAGYPLTSPIRPFERTFELDSTFAPPFIHLVQVAHTADDSAAARRWSDYYLDLDSTSIYARSFALVTELRFGSPEDSLLAEETFGNSEADLIGTSMCSCLGGRKSLGAYEAVAATTRANPRLTDRDRGWALLSLGSQYLRRGRVAAAVNLFKQGLSMAPEADRAVLNRLIISRSIGLAADTASRQLIERLAGQYSYPQDLPFLGVLAAAEGHTADADSAAARFDALADSILSSSGDSVWTRTLAGHAASIRGQIAAGNDDADAAIAHFRRAVDLITANWSTRRDLSRYWLANVIEVRGGEEEALKIYGSLYHTPYLEALGYLRRAQLHERRGETAEAVRYYSYFLELWSEADPYLQPQVESARRAVDRLAGEGAAAA